MVVLDTYNSLANLAYTIVAVWDGAFSTARTEKATCASVATLLSLRLSMMKWGLPSATLRFDAWDSAMNLVDWTATFNASTLTGVFRDKTLNFTQSYVCALNEVLWVGCRCTAAVLIDSSNFAMLETDIALPNTTKDRNGGAWSLQSGKLDFTLNGTALAGAQLRRLLVGVGL